ncbi:MAG TPA: hypothetical protein VFQ57_06750 [Sphingomonas sp.]|jgi:hypothetical protein|nr:hypothetical protein [Sphingomonas sp.]
MRACFAIVLAGVAIGLAGCGDRGGNGEAEGTSITLNGDDGNVAGALDGKSGELKFDLPGFKGAIKLPRIKLNAADFDLNGVHLYPGSTIDRVDVAGNGDEDGNLRVAFSSPAAPQIVRDWFRRRLAAAGYDLRVDGNALVGRDQDKKPFRLNLTPSGSAARGTIVLGD